MFDEQPDADPHGECAAEIRRLQAALRTIYDRAPRRSAPGSDRNRMRCRHCQHAWGGDEPGLQEEHHGEGCAWVIARDALAPCGVNPSDGGQR